MHATEEPHISSAVIYDLEEHPTRWNHWALLVEVILAKRDREEAVRIANHVAELETRAPELKAFGRVMILMYLGDRAGAVELIRPYFTQRSARILLRQLHRFTPVPQSMADYAPFQELVGWAAAASQLSLAYRAPASSAAFIRS